MPGGSGAENLSPFGYVQRAYTSRYASFAGRARRAEFGWFILITWVVGLVLSGVGRSGVGSALLGLFWLAALIPYIAVAVRRLHDMNMSGWVLLVVLVPLVNFIFFLVMLFSDSQRAPNKWGRSPKYG